MPIELLQDRDTHSDFLLTPSPAKCSFSGGANLGKALYKPSIMTHEAKKGPNLCVSLWQCVLSNGLYIGVLGETPCFDTW